MEELVIYIREAVDRKQENMRRKRRRDALRLQLVKVLEKIAENGTFGVSTCVLERESMSLHPTFVEYMEGARLYLEAEIDKDNVSIREVKIHFCDFIRKMIKNFSRKYIFFRFFRIKAELFSIYYILTVESCITLLSRELRRNLFNLFASWSGIFSKPLGLANHISGTSAEEEKLQFCSLQVIFFLWFLFSVLLIK